MNYVVALIQAANPAWEDIFLLLPHDWDNGGGHKPLNSVAAKMLRVSCDPLGERSMILLDTLLPNRLLRSPEQGANLWQSDQVGAILRSANTEGGLLLQSDKRVNYCVRRHDHSLRNR